ncbi:unnamed protein product [Lupinus luteus]|uniref:Uncharacterized protein n=1 Tax=Lupinus luteus TaxID=3873 RepID=A0AAV1VY62_LUPLU
MAPSRVPHFGGKSFEPTIGGLAACLPAHAPWWVRMARNGAPPNTPAGYPKHDAAFFHGVVGSSTESSSMPNPGRTWLGGLVVRLSCRGACLVARLGVGLFGYPAGVPRLLV